MMRDNEFYAIQNKDGNWLIDTLSLTKNEAIQKALNGHSYEPYQWRWLYQDGYRAKKVTLKIREASDETSS